MNKVVRIIPLLILTTCLILLASGSPLLVKPIVAGSEFPFGSLIAWLGISSLPLSLLFGIHSLGEPPSRGYKVINLMLKGLTLLGLVWGLVSYLLAGNWSFSFGGSEKFQGSHEAFAVFTFYTAILVSLSLLIILVVGIHQLILRTK
jgi:hypothetical protein